MFSWLVFDVYVCMSCHKVLSSWVKEVKQPALRNKDPGRILGLHTQTSKIMNCWHKVCCEQWRSNKCFILFFKVFIFTTSEGRFMPNVSVTAVFLCKAATVTTSTGSTRPRSARSPVAAAWRSSTTSSSPSCLPSQSITVLKWCMSWPRCVLFEWVLLK